MFRAVALGQAIAWALVAVRLAGFVVGSPFPGAYVSNTQRVGLVVVLAWAASMFAPSSDLPTELGLNAAGAAAGAVAGGVAIGIAFRMLFMAADTVGQVLAEATGLSSASVMNPTVEAEDTIMSRIVTLMALLLALTAGVHRTALAYLLASFRALPLGHVSASSVNPMALLDLTVRSFVVGVQIGLPVAGVALIVQLGLAMVARAAPSLQIFSVGFSVLVLTGLVVTMTELRGMGAGLLAHYESLPNWLDIVFVVPAGTTP